MQSTRYSRPMGHLGTGLTFAVPFGILGLIAAASLGHPALGVALLAWSLLNRIVQSIAVGYGVIGDRRALRLCWLYPLRDLLGFIVWLGSYCGGSNFRWRGELYRFTPGGRIVSIQRASDSRLPEMKFAGILRKSAPGPASLSPRQPPIFQMESFPAPHDRVPAKAGKPDRNSHHIAHRNQPQIPSVCRSFKIGPHSTYPEAKRATATAPSSASDHTAPPAHNAAAIAQGSPKVSSTPT